MVVIVDTVWIASTALISGIRSNFSQYIAYNVSCLCNFVYRFSSINYERPRIHAGFYFGGEYGCYN